MDMDMDVYVVCICVCYMVWMCVYECIHGCVCMLYIYGYGKCIYMDVYMWMYRKDLVYYIDICSHCFPSFLLVSLITSSQIFLHPP